MDDIDENVDFVLCSSGEETEDNDSKSGDTEEKDSEVFYFETDQLALKANKDYHNLLRIIFILEAQRESAMKAVEKVSQLLREAEEDPIAFVEKLKSGASLGLPGYHKIPKIPTIDWSRYKLPPPPDNSAPPAKTKYLNETDSKMNLSLDQSWDHERRSKVLVRGRAFDDSKPETFNQLWTAEEQRRLEELLVEYPPEEVETRRWEKIADALGNRTAKQVQSRVQKYFIKLHKAGLPIPGRCPRLQNESQLRKAFHKHQRNNHFLFKPSTFFPSHDLQMNMSDSDDESSYPKMTFKDYQPQDNGNAEGLVDLETNVPLKRDKNSVDSLKLEVLKRVHKEMEKTRGDVKFEHIGYKCEFCKEEPIRGTRWHCDECMSRGESVDYCSDCVISLLDNEVDHLFSSVNTRPQNCLVNPHPLEHQLRPIRSQTGKTTSGSWDPDYMPASFSGGYNYLDPNFMPE